MYQAYSKIIAVLDVGSFPFPVHRVLCLCVLQIREINVFKDFHT